MSELFAKLWTMYQSKPVQVTVLSTGALHVDAARLLSSEEAKRQIQALEDFPLQVEIVRNVMERDAAEVHKQEAKPAG
ncbi:MAG: hypothetical protein EPO20_05815 [Betaproteobacteria bacterium]|nr:MAG: hypothetical protein EPO20_05815 [Betaproteobacteria bacterium]